jgi:hypothetical protein
VNLFQSESNQLTPEGPPTSTRCATYCYPRCPPWKMPERTNHNVFRAVGSVTSRDVVPISSRSLRHKRYLFDNKCRCCRSAAFAWRRVLRFLAVLHQRLIRCHCELVIEDHGTVPEPHGMRFAIRPTTVSGQNTHGHLLQRKILLACELTRGVTNSPKRKFGGRIEVDQRVLPAGL